MFLISRSTSTAATTTFSSIPQGYHGLRIVVIGKTVAAAATDALLLNFNGDVGATYSWQVGYASAAASTAIEDTSDTWVSLQTAALAGIPGSDAGNEANTVGVADITIWGYSSTVFNKIITATIGYKTVAATTGMDIGRVAGMWASTSAITSIGIATVSARVSGSSVSLYGIA